MRNQMLSAAVLATASLGLAAGLALTGCAHQRGPVSDAATPTQMMVPVLAVQGDTKESQSKEGLTISIAPATYTTAIKSSTTWTMRPQMIGDGFLQTPDGRPPVYAIGTTTSSASVKPKHLAFTVTIKNDMPRVFHGTGTVVQFNVAGHLLAVDQQLYADLQSAIVPPNNTAQVHIYGPAIDDLPPEATSVTLNLYDVVTAQNDAGAVTDKQNYQWDFSLKQDVRTVNVPGTVTDGKLMSVQDYEAKAAESGAPNTRVRRARMPTAVPTATDPRRHGPRAAVVPGVIPDPAATPGGRPEIRLAAARVPCDAPVQHGPAARRPAD